MAHRSIVRAYGEHRRTYCAAALLTLVLILLSACSGQLPRVLPATPADVLAQGTPSTTAVTGTVVPAPAFAPGTNLLALPSAFRYEVTLRPVQVDAPATVITGQYRDGAWAQSSHTGDQAGEELVVAPDPATNRLNSYTRAAGDAAWTRWPGVTFDAAYGLASPFTILRLRPLATRSAIREPGSEPNAAPGVTTNGEETKAQVLFSTEVVQRVLTAGVLAIATNEDTRAALEEQIAPFFVPQTVTYWTDSSDKVTQAAATLLSLGPNNQPAAWVEVTASYSAYGDPAIVIATPENATDIADVAGKDVVTEQPSDVQPGVTLRVRVFSSAGAPAADSVVTAYVGGKKAVASEKLGPDAQFTLKPGLYDVLVRSGGAQQWVKGVAVTNDAVASNDVLFDFAKLTVRVNLNGGAPAVDVVVYPAGEKTDFAGFASENPAHFQLPVGIYDVEAATQDGQARKRVNNVEVRAGLETTLDFDLARP
jgi:hypothetical protein